MPLPAQRPDERVPVGGVDADAARPVLGPHPVVGQPYETTGRPARPRKRPKSELTPVALRLPGRLGGMTANVDRKTSSAMATTFLGGLLVAVGAVLFPMFGGRSKSA